MQEKKKVQRKHRSFQFTLDELFNSARWKIALSLIDEDPMFMRAILTELYLDTVTVVKSKLLKTYAVHSSLNQFEILPLLRSVNDFTTFNTFFNLSAEEQALYMADPKHQMTKEQKAELLARVRKNLMGS